MLNVDENLLKFIQRHPKLLKELFSGHFGLEKENLRVTPEGKLAKTMHPAIFGPKEENPFIKTDFSESQMEMITPVCNSIEEAYDFLTNLHHIISLSLENEELLWPNSNPPSLPENEKEILISIFQDTNSTSALYREHLAEKYGKKIQLFTGVHYNFSFTNTFLSALFERYRKEDGDYQDFKNSIYLKIAKYFLKNRWLLLYLTGCSPIYLENFINTKNEVKIASDTVSMVNGVSLRNSSSGYKNSNFLYVDYNSFDGYIHSLANHIKNGEINSIREIYSPIRLKNSRVQNSLGGLAKHGIDYLEIRSLDLNPLEKIGISKETLYLTHLFFIAGLLTPEVELDYEKQIIAKVNEENIAQNGLTQPAIVTGAKEKKEDFISTGLDELDKMLSIVKQLVPEKQIYHQTLEIQKERLMNQKKTIASELRKHVKREGYISYHLNVAKKAREEASQTAPQLAGATDMELSTQIVLRSALKKGITFEILDRSESFVRFLKKGHVEYVKQATKTSKDHYITALLMENKLVTKKILKEHGIIVPPGDSFTDLESAAKSYKKYHNYPIVIKPKTNNFGIGVTVLKDKFTKKDYLLAVNTAFSYDKSILIEEFIPGEEHRFFVIDSKVEAVLKRNPANITGDGIHTVAEHVDKKNNDPLRGTNYVKPLEKIKKGTEETLMLSMQQMTWESVPPAGKTVYLRENSNISTGGDSIDVTNSVDRYYHDLACRAARLIGAKICGVDIIIPPEPTNYEKAAIIELNFNPAIHIHCFPYKGERRMLGDKILDFLFKK